MSLKWSKKFGFGNWPTVELCDDDEFLVLVTCDGIWIVGFHLSSLINVFFYLEFVKFTLNALGIVFVKWYFEFKTLWIWWKCRWSYAYDDKLGFRYAIALLVLLEVLTSLEGTFSGKENWKLAFWITLAGISCDNLCSLLLTFMLWLIMSWASF